MDAAQISVDKFAQHTVATAIRAQVAPTARSATPISKSQRASAGGRFPK